MQQVYIHFKINMKLLFQIHSWVLGCWVQTNGLILSHQGCQYLIWLLVFSSGELTLPYQCEN